LSQPAPSPARNSRFGNTAIVLFLLAQAADGALTYVGVHTMGFGIEANPLLLGLMVTLGAAPAVLSAKLMAAILGMSLHLLGVHRVVALLTAVYMAGAVVPWVGVLLHMS
jgi:uncharacterized membrane protein